MQSNSYPYHALQLESAATEAVRQLVNDFFGDRGRFTSVVKNKVSYPKARQIQRNDRVDLILAVPGVKREDIEIDVRDGRLVVSGQMSEAYRNDKDEIILNELHSSKWSRAWSIPEDLDIDGISANLEDGMLLITVPVRAEIVKAREPRKIEIGCKKQIATETNEENEAV